MFAISYKARKLCMVCVCVCMCMYLYIYIYIYLLLYIEIYETYVSIYRTKNLTKRLQRLFMQVIQ